MGVGVGVTTGVVISTANVEDGCITAEDDVDKISKDDVSLATTEEVASGVGVGVGVIKDSSIVKSVAEQRLSKNYA